MNNAIPINRSVLNHWIMKDAEYFRIWFVMLATAKYKDNTEEIEEQLVNMKRGEFVFGRKSWSKDWGISEGRLRTLIKKLLKDNMIQLVQNFNKFTIYKVVNYEKYNSQSSQQINHQESFYSQWFEESNYQQSYCHETNKQPSENQQRAIINPANNHIQESKERHKKDNNNIYNEIFDLYVQQGVINHRNLTKKNGGCNKQSFEAAL